MVMDLKRRTTTITSISEAYHTAGAITRHVDGRPGAHLCSAKCIVKDSSDNKTFLDAMHKFTNNPLMVVHERPQQKISETANSVSSTNRQIEDFFLLDFSASTTTTTTTSFDQKDDQVMKGGDAVLVVGKKSSTSSSTPSLSSSTTTTTSVNNRRKTMSLSPVYTIENEGQTMHQLKVSAVPLSLNCNGRIKTESCKKSSDDISGFEKPDPEEGSTLADFLNLLSPDPGFESACGGDCSPPPVDLVKLFKIKFDLNKFKLNTFLLNNFKLSEFELNKFKLNPFKLDPF